MILFNNFIISSLNKIRPLQYKVGLKYYNFSEKYFHAIKSKKWDR